MSNEMLNEEVFALIREVKKKLINYILTAIVVGVGSMVTFYFTTTNRVENLESDNVELKASTKLLEGKVSQIMVSPLVQDQRFSAIMTTMDDFKKEQRILAQRQDKTYDMILEIYKKNK